MFGRFFWSGIYKRLYRSSGKEKESRCIMFTSSTNRKIKHFHVVVVQRRQRNVQKKRDARVKLLFCQSKPIAFLPFSLQSPSSLLKLPIVAVQRNVTNRGRIIVEWCLHWSSGYRSDCHPEGDAFRTRFIRVKVKKPIVESCESSVVGPAFYFYFACRLYNYLQNLLKRLKRSKYLQELKGQLS